MVKIYDGVRFDLSCYITISVPKPHHHSPEDSLAIKKFEVTVVL